MTVPLSALVPLHTLSDREMCLPLCPTQLLKHLLQREFKNKDTKHLSRKFTEWAYGPISCSLYDLEALDTYGDKGSILELVVHGSDNPVSCRIYLQSRSQYLSF